MRILVEQEPCIMGYRLLVECCATPTTATTTTRTTERVLIVLVVVLLLLQLEDITRILHNGDVDDGFRYDSIRDWISVFVRYSPSRCFEQSIRKSLRSSILDSVPL